MVGRQVEKQKKGLNKQMTKARQKGVRKVNEMKIKARENK